MKKMMKQIAAFLLLTVMVLACSKKDTDNSANDPIVGQWQLRVLSIKEEAETIEVTNMPCLKDSYLNITASDGELYFSAHNPETNECKSGTENFQWTNENGSYVLTDKGQKFPSSIQLNDNNETLQLNTPKAILIFRKK